MSLLMTSARDPLATPTPERTQQNPVGGESIKFKLRKARIEEMERQQEMEDLLAIRMTHEDLSTLATSFMSVKAEFDDLDGMTWSKPQAQALLHQWHRQRQYDEYYGLLDHFPATTSLPYLSPLESVVPISHPLVRSRPYNPFAGRSQWQDASAPLPSSTESRFSRSTRHDAESLSGPPPALSTISRARVPEQFSTWSGASRGRSPGRGRPRPPLPISMYLDDPSSLKPLHTLFQEDEPQTPLALATADLPILGKYDNIAVNGEDPQSKGESCAEECCKKEEPGMLSVPSPLQDSKITNSPKSEYTSLSARCHRERTSRSRTRRVSLPSITARAGVFGRRGPTLHLWVGVDDEYGRTSILTGESR